MKWSAVSALLVAPLALAGVVSTGVVARNEGNVKRAGPISVTVGGPNGELFYNPATLTGLKVGDVVRFTLANGAGVHTITQAKDANNLCVAATNGITHTFDPNNPSSLSFDITVQFTAPFFAYCAIPGHCDGGMKFSVNA